MPKKAKIGIFCLKMVEKSGNRARNKKIKTQVLFASLSSSFMHNYRENWGNGEEFYYLEGLNFDDFF